MLIILSPSKTLDETPLRKPVSSTQPEFMADTKELHMLLKRCTAEDVKALMDISDKLAQLNYERYQRFSPRFTERNAKPALFMFKGDVYDPMPVEAYDAKTLDYAQAHLRILSGFYGLLRPLDLMQPYRLEMGTRLANARGKDLYAFWGSSIAQALNNATQKMKHPLLVNLASEEYFKAVEKKALTMPVLQVQFKEQKGGAYKMIGLFAKRARGMMADYMLRERIDTVEGLKAFAAGGYRFQPSLSTQDTLVFTRREKA